jgi:hypothetical protein
VSGRLCGALAGLLGVLGRLLPAGRREWAEAVQAEASEAPDGWPRLGWLAGGVWLVAREASMMRRVLYGAGCAAVAAAVSWVIWLSWQPAGDPEYATDRVRILVGAAALVVLPWVGRRRGLFGPAGRGLVARLVRVGGAAALCGLGLSLIRLDQHHGLDQVLGDGSPNWPREIGGLVALGALFAAPLVVRARWPKVPTEALTGWMIVGAMITFLLLPVQVLLAGYVALVLVATSRRAPVRPAALAGGVITGLPMIPIMYAILQIPGDDNMLLLLGPMIIILALAGFGLGMAVAWRVQGTWSPVGEDGTDADGRTLGHVQARQATRAGMTAGAVAGLGITLILSLVLGLMMILGPLVAAGGAAFGAMTVTDRQRRGIPARSWMAGLFVSRS